MTDTTATQPMIDAATKARAIPLADPVAYAARELASVSHYLAEALRAQPSPAGKISLWFDREVFISLPYPDGKYGAWQLVHASSYSDLWAAHKTILDGPGIEITAFYHRTVPHGTTEEI
jgi:hypothetical protein